MTFEIGLAFLMIFIFIGIAAYALGWEQSVRKWRKNDRARGMYIQDLDSQIAYFNKQMEKDPQRAWVDTGIIHALNTVESAAEELRAEVTKRRERV